MKTYSKKFNAQRAARAELGDDAIEGLDYRAVKGAGGWTWELGRKAEPAKPENFDPATGSEATDAEAEAAEGDAAYNCPPPMAEVHSAPDRPNGKRAAIEEAARRGELPEPPDFSAETHKRFRNKLASLVDLAKSGDLDGLKAMVINPVSSSPKALARYRDLCVIALEARRS